MRVMSIAGRAVKPFYGGYIVSNSKFQACLPVVLNGPISYNRFPVVMPVKCIRDWQRIQIKGSRPKLPFSKSAFLQERADDFAGTAFPDHWKNEAGIWIGKVVVVDDGGAAVEIARFEVDVTSNA